MPFSPAVQPMVALPATTSYRAKVGGWLPQRLKQMREPPLRSLYAREMAGRAVTEAVQIHGGYGFIKEYLVEKLYRDQKITELYEGTSEVQRLMISRGLLK